MKSMKKKTIVERIKNLKDNQIQAIKYSNGNVYSFCQDYNIKGSENIFFNYFDKYIREVTDQKSYYYGFSIKDFFWCNCYEILELVVNKIDERLPNFINLTKLVKEKRNLQYNDDFEFELKNIFESFEDNLENFIDDDDDEIDNEKTNIELTNDERVNKINNLTSEQKHAIIYCTIPYFNKFIYSYNLLNSYYSCKDLFYEYFNAFFDKVKSEKELNDDIKDDFHYYNGKEDRCIVDDLSVKIDRNLPKFIKYDDLMDEEFNELGYKKDLEDDLIDVFIEFRKEVEKAIQ